MLKFLIAMVVTILNFGCSNLTQKKEQPRSPSSNSSPPVSHLTAAELAKFSSLAQSQDSKRLHLLFSHLRKAQILVSTFDQRLEKAQKSTQVDALLRSNLYCKIVEVRTINEEIEEKLLATAKGAYQNGHETTAWFYDQLVAFAHEGIAHQVAMIQSLRVLNNQASDLCGTPNCILSDIKQLKGFSIPPLDNTAFADFVKANKSLIAIQSDSNKSDLEPGSCFEDTKRFPNQSQTYDWKNRNWVGSTLPDGHFIFTYDDGPHKVFSQEIGDAWINAGLVKPTFFWLSKNIEIYPDVVKKINAQGYIIGSHSDRHADLGNLTKAQSPGDFNKVNKHIFADELINLDPEDFEKWKNQVLDREIVRAVKQLSLAIEKPVRYFRLPYGSGTKQSKIGDLFQRIDVDHFFWRVDSLDWQDKNPETIRDRVLTQMSSVKSGIVLFHDVHLQSLEATKLLIQAIRDSKKWKAVPLKALPGLKEGIQ